MSRPIICDICGKEIKYYPYYKVINPVFRGEIAKVDNDLALKVHRYQMDICSNCMDKIKVDIGQAQKKHAKFNEKDLKNAIGWLGAMHVDDKGDIKPFATWTKPTPEEIKKAIDLAIDCMEECEGYAN